MRRRQPRRACPRPRRNRRRRTAAPAAPAGKAAGKTDERLAADAIAAGDYAGALARYKALAAEHPDKPVFKKAVQILQHKVAAE